MPEPVLSEPGAPSLLGKSQDLQAAPSLPGLPPPAEDSLAEVDVQVTSSSGLSPGEAEQAGVPQPVPLRSLLCLREAEGAGVPQHRVDRRVHRPAAQDQDRQLHSHLLTLLLPDPPTPGVPRDPRLSSTCPPSYPLPRLQGCPTCRTGSDGETVQSLVKLFTS